MLLEEGGGFLFTDPRYFPPGEEGEEWKFVVVRENLMEVLRERIERTKIKEIVFEENRVTVKMRKELDKIGGVNWNEGGGWVEEERMRKDEEELKLIREAWKIGEKVLRRVKEFLRPGMEERELAVEVEHCLRKKGSESLPFPPIVTGGKNSALPHAKPGKDPLKEKEPLIVDLGARIEGYCSDITLTFFPGGIPSCWEERKRMVEEAISLAISLVEVGRRCRDVFMEVERFFSRQDFQENFLHSLGHGVGLKVHERPLLGRKSEDVFQPGMVFTLEPGLYFPGEGGVREEIMVYISPEGKVIPFQGE